MAKMITATAPETMMLLRLLLLVVATHRDAAASSIVYDDFTTYNSSVWEYADQSMGTTVKTPLLPCMMTGSATGRRCTATALLHCHCLARGPTVHTRRCVPRRTSARSGTSRTTR